MTDPLSALAPYVLCDPREPLTAVALRIATEACAGRPPGPADLRDFQGDPLAVLRLIADMVRMPTNADRADVYGALADLRVALVGDAAPRSQSECS